MSVVEEFSGVGVDDMLQVRKKTFSFFFEWGWRGSGVGRLRGGGGGEPCFAYVFDLGLPSEFVVDNET